MDGKKIELPNIGNITESLIKLFIKMRNKESSLLDMVVDLG